MKHSTIVSTCHKPQKSGVFLLSRAAGEDGEGDDTDDEEYANAEPTQAYNFDADGEDQEDEDPMECDATVAYNIGGKQRRLDTRTCTWQCRP